MGDFLSTMVFRVIRQHASLLAVLRLQAVGRKKSGCAPVRAWGEKNTTCRVEIFLDPTRLGLDRCEGCPLLKQRRGRLRPQNHQGGGWGNDPNKDIKNRGRSPCPGWTA